MIGTVWTVVKRLLVEIKYQFLYYLLGGRAQLDDFIYYWSNKTELYDKSGEVAVITGGARGLGFEVVRMLLQCNMQVVIGCRNVTAGEKAIEELRSQGVTKGSAVCFSLDTASLASVRSFARIVADKYPKINILINNAGIMFVPYALTEDGVESHFQVNYLGHFILTTELCPNLVKAGASDKHARIVNVTSCAYVIGSLHYDERTEKEEYIGSRAYARSKLAQLISTIDLDRRCKDRNLPVSVYAVHPGVVDTELFDGTFLKTLFPWLPRLLFKTPVQGAMSIVHAAISPLLENETGVYITNCRVTKYKESAALPKQAEKLEEITKRYTSYKSI